MNIPDNWVILEIINGEDTIYKVLAGWAGGYLHGDSWRMNSGIKEVLDKGKHYDIIGYSGSVYRCRKDVEQLRMNIGGILRRLQAQYPGAVKVVNIENTRLNIKKKA